jgi:rubrerythrin
MELQEALKIALDYERKVCAHYADGAKSIADPAGKKVFETLAKEEQGHIAYLESRLAEWTKTGRVSVAELASILPTKQWLSDSNNRANSAMNRRIAEKKELELLKIAVQMENETSEFYRKLVSQLSSNDQNLFEKFLEIEEGHVSIVQAELDSVQGLGYWFDVPEFALESE